MKETSINELLAVFMGWHVTTGTDGNKQYITPDGMGRTFSPPLYTDDHNTIQRVLSAATFAKHLRTYSCCLNAVCRRDGQKPVVLATPRDKCEAALRALGLWEELIAEPLSMDVVRVVGRIERPRVLTVRDHGPERGCELQPDSGVSYRLSHNQASLLWEWLTKKFTRPKA